MAEYWQVLPCPVLGDNGYAAAMPCSEDHVSQDCLVLTLFPLQTFLRRETCISMPRLNWDG